MYNVEKHALTLIDDYKQKRSNVLISREKKDCVTTQNKDFIKKHAHYENGLKYISEILPSTFRVYLKIFNLNTPEVNCTLDIKSLYPNRVDLEFFINNHRLRIFSRECIRTEKINDIIVDGMLYCETTYKKENRKLEVQAGLHSQLGDDAWICFNEKGEIKDFINDILPILISSIWNRGVLSLIHSTETN